MWIVIPTLSEVEGEGSGLSDLARVTRVELTSKNDIRCELDTGGCLPAELQSTQLRHCIGVHSLTCDQHVKYLAHPCRSDQVFEL